MLSMEKVHPRIIVSGGGTGGHIFPAIAIANAIREMNPEAEILFVGALGRMEMERVPAAGYNIVGLPVVGLQRKLTLKNLLFPFKLLQSLWAANKILANFKPNMAIGVGGYASGPILKAAQRQKIPTLIQEQNSYAGITNRLLAKNASAICVAFDGMERYFPKEKIIMTGNPVRQGLEAIEGKVSEALEFFRIPRGSNVILVTGGSLGAKTINQSILENLNLLAKEPELHLIWQTGKNYFNDTMEQMKQLNSSRVRVFEFLERMDLAYAAATIVIARAGAGTISELCQVGKPAILVPSPNVSEDHQTKNAMALARKNAAIVIADSNARQLLVAEAVELVNNEKQASLLSKNIKALANPNAAIAIAAMALKLCSAK